jgi:translation initiation factor 4G
MRIKDEAEVKSVAELEMVIHLIFKKALLEMHYCETYAALVWHLKTVMPEFPPENEGAKPVTFKSTLLTVCQEEFEALPKSLNDEEEEQLYSGEDVDLRRQKRKQRVLANMRFIGNLYLHKLLTEKIISQVIGELTKCEDKDSVPEEHIIECICELLLSIGFTLEQNDKGKGCLQQVCGRLKDLKQRKNTTGKGIYSKRIQFSIQDVLDTRQDGWKKRSFKASAKTKEEVRIEHEQTLKAQAQGKRVDDAEVTVAGARPAFIDERK